MFIIVNGTKVTAWSEQPIEGNGVLFDLSLFPHSNEGPGAPDEGMCLHGDGRKGWQEVDALSSAEVLATILLNTPEIVDNIPDSDIAHMAPYIQDGMPGVEYSAGDKRSYNNLVYKCLQGHTSQESWNPADTPSLWAKILGGQSGEVGVWEQPDSTNPYMKGNRVYFPTEADSVYESDIDNNVWPPDQYGGHFVYTPVTPEPEPEPEPTPEPEPIPEPEPEIQEGIQPDSTNPYMAGDHVMHNGIEGVNIIDNNVGEPGVYGWEQVA